MESYKNSIEFTEAVSLEKEQNKGWKDWNGQNKFAVRIVFAEQILPLYKKKNFILNSCCVA